MDSSIRAEYIQIPSLLADLNALLANSTLLANPLQLDLESSAADPTDTIRIVRGRTLNSKNLLYCGFRYVNDGKLSTITKRQPWKCFLMKMKCKGRLHTINEQLGGGGGGGNGINGENGELLMGFSIFSIEIVSILCHFIPFYAIENLKNLEFRKKYF